ncbi:MAG: hypothetical protein O3B42_10020 [Actinomycetota bacterium]|nr:hypothetical protein [Actinomycetota bacterium]
MSTAATEKASDTSRLDARHQAVVRLIAGAIGEGIDRLMALSSALDDADADPESTQVVPLRADPTLMAVLGWVSELPEQVRSASRSASQVVYPVARAAGVVWDTGAYVARATGVTPFLQGFTEPFLTAMGEERERLTSVGTAEYARGRVLAVQVFEQSVDGIMGYIGESDELGELVREQTLGITGSAVREIRETGAAADGLTEGLFRKLLGKEKRPVPPMPVPQTE